MFTDIGFTDPTPNDIKVKHAVSVVTKVPVNSPSLAHGGPQRGVKVPGSLRPSEASCRHYTPEKEAYFTVTDSHFIGLDQNTLFEFKKGLSSNKFSSNKFAFDSETPKKPSFIAWG